MGGYFSELHRKPDHHKKRFAFVVSLAVTLFIFGIWSLVVFGVSDNKIIVSEEPAVVSERDEGAGFFGSLYLNLASGFTALGTSFRELKDGVKSIDLESEYIDMRDSSLEIYGQ